MRNNGDTKYYIAVLIFGCVLFALLANSAQDKVEDCIDKGGIPIISDGVVFHGCKMP